MPVLANMGSPLMWAGLLHLVVGNALLGVLEGLGVAALLGVRRRHAIPALVLANYLSAWVGAWAIQALFEPAVAGVTVYGAWTAIALGVAGFFAATVVLELPFVLALDLRHPHALRRAAIACAAVQAATYLLLILWYGGPSSATLLTETERDPSLAFLAGRTEWVAFADDDGRRFRVPLAGGPVEPVPAPPPGECEVPPEGGAAPPATEWVARGRATGRLSFRNERTGETLALGMQTPVLSWTLRDTTVLPGEVAVFQAGRQVLALDLRSRKLGLLAIGRSPVVEPASFDGLHPDVDAR